MTISWILGYMLYTLLLLTFHYYSIIIPILQINIPRKERIGKLSIVTQLVCGKAGI